MATPYNEVTDGFIGTVTDYNFFELLKEDRDEWLTDLMKKACAKFRKLCRKDLSKRDDELGEFEEDLDDDEIGIINQLMVVEWLTPKLFSIDNLENILNTKDYSAYSPANLLKEIRSTHEYAKLQSKNMINNYTFSFVDIGDAISDE